MRRQGVYRFSLQFPGDTEERGRAGELLERLGNRKSAVVVAALNQYLDQHPQLESPAAKVKIQTQAAVSREQLEQLVREILEERMAALPQAGPSPEEEDPGISQMLENLDAFL